MLPDEALSAVIVGQGRGEREDRRGGLGARPGGGRDRDEVAATRDDRHRHVAHLAIGQRAQARGSTTPLLFTPPPVALTNVTVAGNVSVTATPPALDGPKFVTDIV